MIAINIVLSVSTFFLAYFAIGKLNTLYKVIFSCLLASLTGFFSIAEIARLGLIGPDDPAIMLAALYSICLVFAGMASGAVLEGVEDDPRIIRDASRRLVESIANQNWNNNDRRNILALAGYIDDTIIPRLLEHRNMVATRKDSEQSVKAVTYCLHELVNMLRTAEKWSTLTAAQNACNNAVSAANQFPDVSVSRLIASEIDWDQIDDICGMSRGREKVALSQSQSACLPSAKREKN